jgi:16S rRNA (uracil1498-N3)-methyltransferase
MPHFHVPPENVRDGRFALAPGESHHVSTVLRKKPGDALRLFDGVNRTYRAVIESVADDRVTGRVIEDEVLPPEPYRLRLFQGLPKGDKFEWIVEKAVELGAAEIIPVVAARSVARPDAERAAARVERWRKIARAAEKQSGRLRETEIALPCSWTDALARCGRGETILVPWEGENARPLAEVLSACRAGAPGPTIDVFIGPEGGLTMEEVSDARRAGAVTVTLGERILRTETAGLYVASALHYEFSKR